MFNLKDFLEYSVAGVLLIPISFIYAFVRRIKFKIMLIDSFVIFFVWEVLYFIEHYFSSSH